LKIGARRQDKSGWNEIAGYKPDSIQRGDTSLLNLMTNNF